MSPTLYTAKNNGGNDNGDSTTMANNGIGFGVVGQRYSVCEEGRNEHPPTVCKSESRVWT